MLASGEGTTPGVVFAASAPAAAASHNDLLRSIVAADSDMLSEVRETTSWFPAGSDLVSEFNENYRCKVLAIGAGSTPTSAVVYIRFVVDCDGSLGPLQAPTLSRITIGSLPPVTPMGSVYVTEDPMSRYAGTLAFEVTPLIEAFMESEQAEEGPPQFFFQLR